MTDTSQKENTTTPMHQTAAVCIIARLSLQRLSNQRANHRTKRLPNTSFLARSPAAA